MLRAPRHDRGLHRTRTEDERALRQPRGKALEGRDHLTRVKRQDAQVAFGWHLTQVPDGPIHDLVLDGCARHLRMRVIPHQTDGEFGMPE